jgi:hypothetical protein
MSLFLALALNAAVAQQPPTPPIEPVPAVEPVPDVDVEIDITLEDEVDRVVEEALEDALEGLAEGEIELSRASRLLADQRVEVKGSANDLFVLAQDARLRAPVGDNAFVLAQDVSVDAPLSGDAYAMGESIEFDAPVAGDIYAMGGRIEILEGAAVNGNVNLMAGEVVIRAPIAGDVSIQAGRVELAAPIAGDLTLEVGEVVVEGDAAVAGSLDYAAPESNAALEQVTLGDVTYTVQEIEPEGVDTAVAEIEVQEEEGSSILVDTLWWGGMRGWGFFTKLLVGFVLLAIGGRPLANIGREIAANPGKSLGIGFIAACVLPVASTVAIVTVVPFPLGLLGFAALGILAYVGQIFAAQAVGDFLLKRVQPDAVGSPYLSLAVGLVPLIALCALPWLGNLAWLGFTCAGIGGLWSVTRGARA